MIQLRRPMTAISSSAAANKIKSNGKLAKVYSVVTHAANREGNINTAAKTAIHKARNSNILLTSGS